MADDKLTVTITGLGVEESIDNGSRLISYCRDGNPVIGLEITPSGTIVVGRWLPDGRWITLHTDIPEETERP